MTHSTRELIYLCVSEACCLGAAAVALWGAWKYGRK